MVPWADFTIQALINDTGKHSCILDHHLSASNEIAACLEHSDERCKNKSSSKEQSFISKAIKSVWDLPTSCVDMRSMELGPIVEHENGITIGWNREVGMYVWTLGHVDIRHFCECMKNWGCGMGWMVHCKCSWKLQHRLMDTLIG